MSYVARRKCFRGCAVTVKTKKHIRSEALGLEYVASVMGNTCACRSGILHWSLLHKGAMHRSFWGPWGGGKVINAPWINLQNSIRLSMIHPALMCFFRWKSNHYKRSPLIFRHGIMIPQLFPKSRNSRFIESCMMESSCSVVIDYKFITKIHTSTKGWICFLIISIECCWVSFCTRIHR